MPRQPSTTAPHCFTSRRLAIASVLLAATTGLPAQADSQEDDALAVPQVAACSQRYPLVASPRPATGNGTAKEAIRQGFGTDRDWGTEQNVEILPPDATGLGEPGLRVHYPEGTSSPGDTEEGGAGFYTEEAAFQASDRGCLQYRVRFEPGFDFVKGGKLPGLYGGEGPSGGTAADGENGFSMRFMWREDGQGELYEYVVNQDEEEDYGASVGRGLWHFPTGRWVTIEQEIILNDPDQENGVARVWIDGAPMLEQNGIVYRTTDSVTIDGLMFSSFFGGDGEEWRTPRDQIIDFAAFRFYAPGP
ncbi:polysaccharide lyase [Litchfieldella rifensis]|uniref:Polysaccharide lyase n=1 Tax=Litchfieldella rifensis TaxID=762643 RepID=A0ABV7LLA9_9GAMM